MSSLLPLPDEAKVVGLAAKGDSEALGLLIDQYLPFAYKVAYGLVLDAYVADDIASDAFEAIIIARDRLDPERNFRGLVHKTVVRKAMTYFTKTTREARRTNDSLLDLPDDALSVEEAADVASSRELLGRALATLSDSDQEVIRVRYIEGKSVAEAAQSLQISPAAVKVRLHRALKRLRKAVVHGK